MTRHFSILFSLLASLVFSGNSALAHHTAKYKRNKKKLSWRLGCIRAGKCTHPSGKKYVVKLDGRRIKVSPVSDSAYQAAPFRWESSYTGVKNIEKLTNLWRVDSSYFQSTESNQNSNASNAETVINPVSPNTSYTQSEREQVPTPSLKKKNSKLLSTPPSSNNNEYYSSGEVATGDSKGGSEKSEELTIPTPTKAPKKQAATSDEPTTSKDFSCGGLSEKVVSKFKNCMSEVNYKIPKGCYVSIADAEKKRGYFLEEKNGKFQCSLSYAVGLGRGQIDAKNPKPGYAITDRGKVAAGLFITSYADGKKFKTMGKKWKKGRMRRHRDAKGGRIGLGFFLSCVSPSDCKAPSGYKTQDEIMIHTARPNNRANDTSRTIGCISVPRKKMRAYRDKVLDSPKSYGCPHFNYFDEGSCGSQGKIVRGRPPSRKSRRKARRSSRKKWRSAKNRGRRSRKARRSSRRKRRSIAASIPRSAQ